MSLIVTTNKLTSKKFLSCLKATDKQQVRNFFHFFFFKKREKKPNWGEENYSGNSPTKNYNTKL